MRAKDKFASRVGRYITGIREIVREIRNKNVFEARTHKGKCTSSCIKASLVLAREANASLILEDSFHFIGRNSQSGDGTCHCAFAARNLLSWSWMTNRAKYQRMQRFINNMPQLIMRRRFEIDTPGTVR